MLYWFENSGNNVFRGDKFVFLLSSRSSHNSGLSVEAISYRNSIATFSARALPKHTWINDQDRYMVPLEKL